MFRKSSGTEWSSLDRERVSMVMGIKLWREGKKAEGD
jgi:hypothetical protein